MPEPLAEPKKNTTITIAVTPEFKKQVQAVAKKRRWSTSQTISVFIEEYWDIWLDELGMPKADTPSKPAS